MHGGDDFEATIRRAFARLTREDLPRAAAAHGWPVRTPGEFERLLLDHLQDPPGPGPRPAPCLFDLVLAETSEAYDEGRVSERLLIGAHLPGLGGGTAWFGDRAQQARGKEILGIPEEKTARSVVVLGYTTTSKDPRPGAAAGGRKPLAEVVSYGRFGAAKG